MINDLNEKNIYESTFAIRSIDGKTLSDFAKKNLYRFCSLEEVIENISRKDIYKKHTEYLKRNWHNINPKQFAKKIGLEGLFRTWKLKKLIFS